MASLFLLIAALVLSRAGAGPLVDPRELGAGTIAALTLSGTIGLALLAAIPGQLPHLRASSGGHLAWSRSTRRTRWIGVISCAWLAFSIVGLGWLAVVRSWMGTILGEGDTILLDEAIAIAPAIAAMSIAWWWHSAYAVLGGTLRARAGFVLTQMRVYWPIFLVPVALILASQEIVERFVRTGSPLALERSAPGSSALAEWLSLGAAIAALLVSPAVVMPFLSTAPLPERPGLSGPIATLFARRGVRVRSVRLWRTGGTLMNAVALGVLPWCRWVLLSDLLLAHLADDEALAVAGHEAAHLRHHHAAWLAGGIVGAVGCTGLAIGLLVEWLEPVLPREPWVGWTALALLVTISVLLFGALSRLCERQADADSARSLSGGERIDAEAVGSMRRALAVVAFANGIPPKRPSFRHGSIASRRRRLERIVGEPKRRLPVDRAMAIARMLIVAALVLTLASLVAPMPGDGDPARMIRSQEPSP
ncbi:MAG: hypothetical protein FJ253_05170 [Phycisphaerae bacterium]|nr:hypothetical protein [Phycisphaerae bacterium]